MKRGSWLIDRRTFLRGAGALRSGCRCSTRCCRPAARAPRPTRRPGVSSCSSSPAAPSWTTGVQTEARTNFTLGSIQQPLLSFKDRLVILDGVDLKITAIGEGHPHSKGMGGLLTGRELPSGPYETCQGTAGFPAGPSVDQVIAAKIGQGTKFRLVEVAVNWPTDQRDGGKAAPTNCISFSGPGQPVPPSIDPKAVFDRLFAEVGADPDLLALERAKSKSILGHGHRGVRRPHAARRPSRPRQAGRAPVAHPRDRGRSHGGRERDHRGVRQAGAARAARRSECGA